ncbi:hypothetical protein [Hydrogenophaga sp.]|uniref:hypothetical protein n=1 Tax=Hydrogenophaga sp. TaxID=1904254 RepID=UPI0025C0EABA|nr:hypothetical protein [Hydrogenophaga sp.]
MVAQLHAPDLANHVHGDHLISLLKVSAGQWNTLVNFQSALRLLGQFSVGVNSLRLAALSRWHTDQGFPDPTKSALVRQVLKGIRSVHAAPEKRARPLELAVLQQVDQWLGAAIGNAQQSGDRSALLRHTRNRSLMLLGFWRGFRSDELVNLRVENTEVTPHSASPWPPRGPV